MHVASDGLKHPAWTSSAPHHAHGVGTWLYNEKSKMTTILSREFSMPNSETFALPPVARLLDKWLSGCTCVVDPFARNSQRGTITNDLNPDTSAQYHMLAEDFVKTVNVQADVVLFDPPYSPRQISEVYQQVGLKCGTKETQNARLYCCVKDGLDSLLNHMSEKTHPKGWDESEY